jgi:ATP-dependent RNA helicase DDX55/SPB4
MPPKDVTKKDPRAWDALTPPLSDWTLGAIKTMGFTRMTPVQASTIPLFMGNKDVVVEVSWNARINLPK